MTTTEPKLNLSRRRGRVFVVVALVLGLVVGVAAVEISLGYLRSRIQTSDHMDPGMIRYEPTLGWRLAPGWTGAHVNHDFRVTYAINRLGFRGRSDVTQPGRRVAMFGDSFTFGLGVDDDETLVAVLNQHVGNTAAAFNFAAPGYATDQQVLLAERILSQVRVSDVVLVVYLGNDLIDNMLGYPVQGPRGKPYFRRTSDGLALQNTPVPRAAKSGADLGVTYTSVVLAGTPSASGIDRLIGGSEIVRRLGVTWPTPRRLFPAARGRFNESVALFVALVQRLRVMATARNAKLHLVLLPGRSFFADPNGYSAQYQDHIRAEIMSRADAIGAPIVDVGVRWRSALGDQQAVSLYFPYDGHLTAAGNKAVAVLISEVLGLAP